MHAVRFLSPVVGHKEVGCVVYVCVCMCVSVFFKKMSQKVLLTGGTRCDEIKLWNLEKRVCTSTLKFLAPSSGQNPFYSHVVPVSGWVVSLVVVVAFQKNFLAGSEGFVIVANAKRKDFHCVHISLVANEESFVFDYVSLFDVSQPILTGQAKLKANGDISLHCVQESRVQEYLLRQDSCWRPTFGNVAPVASASTPVASVSASKAGEDDKEKAARARIIQTAARGYLARKKRLEDEEEAVAAAERATRIKSGGQQMALLQQQEEEEEERKKKEWKRVQEEQEKQRKEQRRLVDEELERKRKEKEEEQRRKDEKQIRDEEEERKRKYEEERKKREEEAERAEEALKKKMEEEKKRKKEDEEKRKQKQEDDKKRAEEKKKQDEKKRVEDEKKRKADEEKKKVDDEKKRVEDEKKKEEKKIEEEVARRLALANASRKVDSSSSTESMIAAAVAASIAPLLESIEKERFGRCFVSFWRF